MNFKVSLTGVRPTGKFHLGNLISLFFSQKNENNIFLMIADLHGMIDGNYSQDKVNNMVRVLLGVAKTLKIDNNLSLFKQSDNPDHLNAFWILSLITPLSKLKTIVTVKNQTEITLAKFNYSVLMAADILIYRPDSVPVGEDQKQHIELYNFLIRKIDPENKIGLKKITYTCKYRIRDLRDPGNKMSKSSRSEAGIIYLNDNALTIRNKFKKAFSGSDEININSEPIKNMILIVKLLWPQGLSLLFKIKGKRHLLFKSIVGLGISLFIQKLRKEILKVNDETIKKWLLIGKLRSKRRSRKSLFILNKLRENKQL